jgi:hypothetical protein
MLEVRLSATIAVRVLPKSMFKLLQSVMKNTLLTSTSQKATAHLHPMCNQGVIVVAAGAKVSMIVCG